MRNTPEAGADIEAALAPLRDQIFNTARLAGRSEPTEAYAADALSELVRLGASAHQGERSGAPGGGAGRSTDPGEVPGGGEAPGGGGTGDDALAGAGPNEHASESSAADGAGGAESASGEGAGGVERASGEATEPRWARRSRRPDTKVIVLIDHQDLRRGHAEAGETCEITGVGPISVASARSLMADAFGVAIVTDGVDVFTVAHLGRSVSAHQRSALEARGYRCEVPGCGATRALEIDHIDDWHRTWRTQLDRLAWLCRAHHRDKTHRGWRLAGPPGDRRWTAPAGRPSGAGSPAPPATAVSAEGAPTLFGDPAA